VSLIIVIYEDQYILIEILISDAEAAVQKAKMVIAAAVAAAIPPTPAKNLVNHPVSLRKTYVGCFEDSSTIRDLPEAEWTSKTVSVVTCILHCAEKQFTFAGVQVLF